jgi:hypothetical protein
LNEAKHFFVGSHSERSLAGPLQIGNGRLHQTGLVEVVREVDDRRIDRFPIQSLEGFSGVLVEA